MYLFLRSSLVLCKCFPVGLPSQNIFGITFLIIFVSIMTVEDLEKKMVDLIILIIERKLLVYTRGMRDVDFILRINQKKP